MELNIGTEVAKQAGSFTHTHSFIWPDWGGG